MPKLSESAQESCLKKYPRIGICSFYVVASRHNLAGDRHAEVVGIGAGKLPEKVPSDRDLEQRREIM
jgi:hypothetical protein